MTKKRFTSERTDDYNFSDILDENGKWIGMCHIDSADDFVKKFDELVEENEQLKSRINELEIMNEAQSDAIDGLQETMCHLDLSELNGDVE